MSVTNFLYNPERKGKQQLIDEFVIRQSILAMIMDDIESSYMKIPEQHYLLVGQRGTGKTTLLHRIKYAIEDSPVLEGWLIPVIFSEEQYNIGDLANLWENIGQILEDYHGFKGIYAEMEKNLSHRDFEERCWDVLEKQLDGQGKKLVLLIDSIGDFLKKIGEMEVRKLRRILQTKSQLRIIAASPLFLESLLDYKQPLFEFFKVVRLEELSREDTKELLIKLGEIHKERDRIERIIRETPERIEVLRTLAGGVPRTIALMFNIFVEHEHENSVRDLERILDVVTPLYKHRMDDLPPQQQKIVDAVAMHWDPINVKDLKERVRLEGKIVSAQLRQLEKNQVIKKLETDTKNHEYILRERFFNIWYLMRYGRRDDRQRVIWLVRFLESWCTQEEIRGRVMSFIEAVKSNKLEAPNVDFFAKVYTALSDLNTATKWMLQESLPPPYGKDTQYTEDEIKRIADEALLERDYMRCIRVLSRVPRFSTKHYEILGRMIPLMLEEDKDKIIQLSNDFLALFVSNYKDGIHIKSTFEIFESTFGLINYFSIRRDLEDDRFESALKSTMDFFDGMGKLFLFFEVDMKDVAVMVESPVIILYLKRAYASGLVRSLIKLFKEGVIKYENREVPFSELYNPIYLALICLDPEGKKINLAPEKAEIVRDIMFLITGKEDIDK